MLPVVVALQTVVVVQIVEAVAVALGIVYLLRRIRTLEEERKRREQAAARALTAELSNLEATVRAARAETATYLEAVFSGVRGLALNLDAARNTSAETLEELKQRSTPPAPQAPFPPPPPADSDDRMGRTLDDARPVRLVEVKQPRRK